MIKFFRRIRQQLLTESKFSRYLLYAVGEIVLVVVGILIALGVNNWNQEAKDRQAGEAHLERIHRDLVQDTTSFRRIIVRNEELRTEIRALLVSLYGGVDSIAQVQRMSATYDKALDQVFAPNDKTYRSLVGSGTLGLIGNLELRDAIVDLYGEYDEKGALLAAIRQWMGGVASTVDTETDFIKFNSEAIDIYTTPEMLNASDYAFLNDKDDPRFKYVVRAISAAAFQQQANNAFYHELISRCRAVLQQIDGELK